MSNQTVTYEIKLQPSVIVILAVFALSIFGLAFGSSDFGISDAEANHQSYGTELGSAMHPLVVHISNL